MKEIMNFALFFTIFISLSVHARPNNGIILRDRHCQKWKKNVWGIFPTFFNKRAKVILDWGKKNRQLAKMGQNNEGTCF